MSLSVYSTDLMQVHQEHSVSQVQFIRKFRALHKRIEISRGCISKKMSCALSNPKESKEKYRKTKFQATQKFYYTFTIFIYFWNNLYQKLSRVYQLLLEQSVTCIGIYYVVHRKCFHFRTTPAFQLGAIILVSVKMFEKQESYHRDYDYYYSHRIILLSC